jgi:hypothetical protein
MSGEWGWGACRHLNGSAAVCSAGGGAGEAVSAHEQASRLARQWLINDAANITLSIWYVLHCFSMFSTIVLLRFTV